jgi:hypothetical protein
VAFWAILALGTNHEHRRCERKCKTIFRGRGNRSGGKRGAAIAKRKARGITKFGLDLGATAGCVMVRAVFTETVAGPGFLAGDYVGATGEATLGAGLGANVLIGRSNRTVTLQPLSVGGQIGLNLAVGVAALRLGLPGR